MSRIREDKYINDKNVDWKNGSRFCPDTLTLEVTKIIMGLGKIGISKNVISFIFNSRLKILY